MFLCCLFVFFLIIHISALFPQNACHSLKLGHKTAEEVHWTLLDTVGLLK